jgi:N-hydroxyarylamine O-acetyltransferase
VDDDDLRAYLERLGLEAEPPSADALFRLHRAHVERVPYETVWLHLGQQWSIDPSDSVGRIARRSRGGYCFMLNGAFSELLRALGYDVGRHVGGVHGPDGATEESMANHLVLSVSGLPTDANPDGVWYVDAGLGDALHEPLPLRAGEYHQGPFTYTLSNLTHRRVLAPSGTGVHAHARDDRAPAPPAGVADWGFTHDASGSFRGMSWRAPRVEMSAFAAQHAHLSTSPESMFVQFLIAQRRDAGGVDIMVGLGLRRVDGTGSKARVVTERADWFGALHDVFGLRFDDIDPAALDRLWDAQLDAYEKAQTARRAAQ